MPSPQPPRFYFSFRSPYSWLAHHDLTVHHPEAAGRLRWIPFWEPDARSERLLAEAGGTFPYTPMSRAKHLYILQDVRRLAAARGLAVTWPVDRSPCWEVPHLAYLLAEREGRGRAFAERVYRARWQEGRDVCDRATIAGIAAAVGLPAEAAAAADDEAARRLGLEALLTICRQGIFGVPYFVNGFERFWGVERLDAFLTSLAAAPRPAPAAEPAAPAPGRTSDGGHAGGCG
jgi:2-hydroxychromene-2-carboxylate isomerase